MKRGDFLALKRMEKKLSVADLAREIGVSEFTVERWEEGELPDSAHLLALASALGVTVEDILREESDESASFADGDNGAFSEERDDGTGYGDAEPDEQENADTQSGTDSSESIGPSGHNGYFAAERKFGYFVFAVFLIAVVITSLIQTIGWINRPRELTIENYNDFITVSISPTTNANPDEYVVKVTAKEDITDLHITVEVYFSGSIDGDRMRTVYLSGNLKKGESVKQTVRLTGYAINTGHEVTYINGGLA